MLELRILADRDALAVWSATTLAEQEHATVDDTPMTVLIPEGLKAREGPGTPADCLEAASRLRFGHDASDAGLQRRSDRD